MATPIFPAVLPGVSSLSWGPLPALKTDSDTGPQDARRISKVAAASAQVSWRFLQDDFEIFLNFWEVDLIRGHRWFMLTLPCAGGYLYHVVRFKSYHSAKSEGYNFRTVTAQLEVRERMLRKPAVPISITSRPYPVYDVDKIETSVSVTAGFLSEGIATFATDGHVLYASVTDGKLIEYVPVDLPPQVEGTAMHIPEFMTLELKTILYEHQDRDHMTMSASVTGGTLKPFVIQRYPEDGYDSTCVIAGGYLT